MQQQLAMEQSPCPLLLSGLHQVYIKPVCDSPLRGQCGPAGTCVSSVGNRVSDGGPGRSMALLALRVKLFSFVGLWISLTSGKRTPVQRLQGSYSLPKWSERTVVFSSPCKYLCLETELEGCCCSQPCLSAAGWMVLG